MGVACCMEEHDDGNKHYHMCIKFSGNRRWKEGKNCFYRKHGVSVHFSASHTDYASAFEYVTKEDLATLKSADHPPLLRVAKTRQATVAVRNKANAKRGLSEAGPVISSSKTIFIPTKKCTRPLICRKKMASLP